MLEYVYWPAGMIALGCAAGAAVASIRFLRSRNLLFDSISVALIEIAMLLLAVHLAAGVAWDHSASGRWWNWNTPLTSALACGLIYAGYLILRHAVEEPSQRASFCAVFAIFAVIDIPIMILAIDWWTKRKGQPPVLAPFRPGQIDRPLAIAASVGVALLALWLVVMRVRREEAHRERDARRRMEQVL